MQAHRSRQCEVLRAAKREPHRSVRVTGDGWDREKWVPKGRSFVPFGVVCSVLSLFSVSRTMLMEATLPFFALQQRKTLLKCHCFSEYFQGRQQGLLHKLIPNYTTQPELSA